MLLICVGNYLKLVVRDKFLIWLPTNRTLYLREQRCEDSWLFFEAKNWSASKEFWGKNRIDFSVNETENLATRTRTYVVCRSKVSDFSSEHCQGPHRVQNPALFPSNGYNNNNNNNNNSNIPGKHEVKELQKTATLGTAHTLRTVLM